MTATLTRQNATGARDTLTIDAVPTFTVDRSANITDHPIESGGSITDHSQRLPWTVTLRGLQTETPFLADVFGVGPARIADTLAWLDASMGQLLTLAVPDSPTIRNLMIQAAPYTGNVSNSVDLTVTLKQVRIVETQSVAIPSAFVRPRADVKAAVASTASLGETQTEPATERQKTLAVTAFDIGKSFFRSGGG